MTSESKTIKVLMLPKWYPGYLDLAEGNYVQRHIKAISKVANVAVLYVHSDKKIKPGNFVEQVSSENNILTVSVFFNQLNSGVGIFNKAVNISNYLKAQLRGYKLLKAKFGKPDLAHVHVLTRTCLFALYLKWRFGIPF